MRLLRLYLKRYRVLQNLLINFTQAGDTTYTLDFVVGVNGTGKSTLLRAIAEIFQRLATGSKIGFGFEVTYLRDGTTVTISNLTSDYEKPLSCLRIAVDGGAEQQVESGDIPKSYLDYLPPLIVAFTTGSEREWEVVEDMGSQEAGQAESSISDTDTPVGEIERLDEEGIQRLTELYLTELPGLSTDLGSGDIDSSNQKLPTDNFLLIRAHQLPLVILCGLLSDMLYGQEVRRNDRLEKVLREAGIRVLQGFSLKFRMNRGIITDAQRVFVETLARSAQQRLSLGADYLLVYDLAGNDYVERVRKFVGPQSNPMELFRQLTKLYMPLNDEPILREVNLFLERALPIWRTEGELGEIVSPLHLLEWFSDGEQSFLGRLCLFTLLGDQEALILLDEPEVHFNDFWKREVVHMLDEVLQKRKSHVILTSHSSITLTDVSRENIRVLYRDEDRTTDASPPQMETLAADPSDIIVNIFGAPQATGAQSIMRIENKLKVLSAKRSLAEQEEDIEALLRDMAPGYWRFLVLRKRDEIRRKQRETQRRQTQP